MIDTQYLKTMARYNRWQNENLYSAADQLDDDARRLDRGAFFGSIHGTLCHILWADQIWMHRFSGSPKPLKSNADSHHMIEDWQALKQARTAMDQMIQECLNIYTEKVSKLDMDLLCNVFLAFIIIFQLMIKVMLLCLAKIILKLW